MIVFTHKNAGTNSGRFLLGLYNNIVFTHKNAGTNSLW